METKIKINRRGTEEEAKESHKELKKLKNLFGNKININLTLTIFKRKCDNCDRIIKKGEKYKGEGMNEYCEYCVNKEGIKGKWKINKGIK